MARRNPFALVFGLGTAFSVIHLAAHIFYCVSLLAVRFHDQINDPWHTWTWAFFAISVTLIIPMFVSMMLKSMYDVAVMYSVQTVICAAWAGWGFFHFIILMIAFTNCNDMDGGDPEYPHCINRDFPAEDWPDFSMYAYFITVAIEAGCCLFWLWYGFRIRMAAYALEFAAAQSQGLVASRIGGKVGAAIEDNPFQHYKDYLADEISSSLIDQATKQTRRTLSPKELDLYEATGVRLGDALADYLKSRKYGIVPFADFYFSHNPHMAGLSNGEEYECRPGVSVGSDINDVHDVVNTFLPNMFTASKPKEYIPMKIYTNGNQV